VSGEEDEGNQSRKTFLQKTSSRYSEINDVGNNSILKLSKNPSKSS
jgi:hypothetical protein